MKSNDELMWLIADEGDSSAMEAFIKRHPELRGEMYRRAAMVRSFKGARPSVPEDVQIPAFRVQPEVREFRTYPRAAAVLAFAAALCTIGFASFIGVKTAMGTGPDKPTPHTTVASGDSPAIETRINTQPDYDPQMNVVPPSPPPLKPLEKPINLTLLNEMVTVALNDISRQTGLDIQIAPGLEPVPVSFTFVNTPALAALNELGKQAGFTVFEEGDHSILIIPVRHDGPMVTSPEDPSMGQSQMDPQPSNDGGKMPATNSNGTPHPNGMLPDVRP